MVHSEEFIQKHKMLLEERKIQKALKEEERQRKREASYQRFLERKKKEQEERQIKREERLKASIDKKQGYQALKNDPERYKEYLAYQRAYREKRKAQKQKEYDERLNEALADKTYRFYKGYYVTDDGEIYNRQGKRCYGSLHRNGYRQHTINGKMMMTHRIVWEAFMGEIPEDMEIDLINTIRDDNRLENLRLVNHIQNCNTPLSLKNYSRGNTTGHCIPIIQVFDDGTEKEWMSAAEAGRNGYNKQCIWHCLNGRLMQHKKSRWYYKKNYQKIDTISR